MLTVKQREARRKTAKEKISITSHEDPNNVRRVVRIRLTKFNVDKIFNKDVEYLQDEGGEVIHPDQWLYRCLPPPFLYFIHEKEVIDLPPDEAENEWYSGETQIVMLSVPIACTEIDLEAWLKKGLETKDEAFVKAQKNIAAVEEELEKNQDRLDKVPFLQAKEENEAAGERRYMTSILRDQRKELEAKLRECKKNLKVEQARRDRAFFKFKLASTNEKQKLSTWYVDLDTESEAKKAVEFNLWMDVRLAIGDAKAKPPIAPVTGFEEIEDEELIDSVVNMRQVRLHRMRHGFGSLIDYENSGAAYRGEWKENVKQGAGRLYSGSGIYEGKFESDGKKGRGTMKYANGDTYEGEFGYHMYGAHVPLIRPYDFTQGTPHGKGTMTFADGSIYTGEFFEGNITGKGKWENPATKEIKEGNFKNGQLDGEGMEVAANGIRREGIFKAGDLCREGKYTSKKGDVYVGTFEKGDFHGRGVYTFRNGDSYEGYFREGMRDGPGLLLYGHIDRIKDSKTGRIFTKHDYRYEGEWMVNKERFRGTNVWVQRKPVTEPLGDKEIPYFSTNHKSSEKFPYFHELVLKEGKRNARSKKKEEKRVREVAKSNLHTIRENQKEYYTARKQNLKLFKRLHKKLQAIKDFFKEVSGEQAENEDDEEEISDDSDSESESDTDSEEESEIIEDYSKYRKYESLTFDLFDILENPPRKDRSGGVKLTDGLAHYSAVKHIHSKSTGTGSTRTSSIRTNSTTGK